MPTIFKNPKNNNINQPDSQAFNQPANTEPAKGLFQLPPALLQWVPFIPFFLEQATGQKIPPMTGTMADILNGIQQIQTNQKEIAARIENLESQATNQLTNLQSQFNAFRLLATKETKAIEFTPPQLESHAV